MLALLIGTTMMQFAEEIGQYAASLRPGLQAYIDPGSESTWEYDKNHQGSRPNGKWDGIANKTLATHKKSGHLIFTAGRSTQKETWTCGQRWLNRAINYVCSLPLQIIFKRCQF